MALETWWKHMLKNKEYSFNLGKCWFQASRYEIVHWSLLCFHFFLNWALCLQKKSRRSEQEIQQIFLVISGRRQTKWRVSKLQCSRRDNGAPGQKFQRLPNYGPEPVTKYLSDKMTHAAIISKLSHCWDHVNKLFYEIELTKPQIEHTEPIFVGFCFSSLCKTPNVGIVLQLFH